MVNTLCNSATQIVILAGLTMLLFGFHVTLPGGGRLRVNGLLTFGLHAFEHRSTRMAKDLTRQQIMLLNALNNSYGIELSTGEIRDILKKRFAYSPSLPGLLLGMERLRSRKLVRRRKEGTAYFSITDTGIEILNESLDFYYALYLTK